MKRVKIVDIIKGIGIISIVIGHCAGNAHVISFVYTYHLMIFFVAAGYCFKTESTVDIKRYVGSKMYGTMIKLL